MVSVTAAAAYAVVMAGATIRRYHVGMSGSDDHQAHLQRAIDLARRHMDAGAGGPFGAVIVRDGQVLGEGWNVVTSANDPTGHAEVQAIRAACRAVDDFQLKGAVLYTSCEPCPMCLAAAYWARIDRIYYANTRAEAAAIGFDDAFIYNEVPLAPEARSLPAIALPSAAGRDLFAAWDAKADKIPY